MHQLGKQAAAEKLEREQPRKKRDSLEDLDSILDLMVGDEVPDVTEPKISPT
ncbi:hypothetical protein PC116_g10546 [Phytophthora cactorum]|uniref:Uncharacterized protein n=1 Tax=Phytophthora cactorum TaxID=29920 RepID=A0A329RYZ8_9STRA|nr:hypothetical protein Pcac1_g4220 [Phytophthora cactorum]KAG2910644.1 hypothetical protein PC114_g9673 [Phytophthora cactorum]KAG2930732.1 hypothetical protein PC117_g13650 [Phytophthora cactorum]KAG3003408.1 hypothetical protein PC119_g16011 [Phytophthora cactorum]KAG3015194.1 hypothetical protein PC120_g12272 [Phytophthora cactorum]